MVFQDLSEDNIRSIFSFCDIYVVVRMSRTNKYIRRITLEKLVWVDLVENLRYRGFIDGVSPSEIRALTQEELIALVKTLVTGPRSWTAPVTPKVSERTRLRSSPPRPPQSWAENPTQIILHPSGIRSSKMNEAKSIAGGEYVLFNNITLECWSVHDDRLVWAYEKNGPDSYVIEFAADVAYGGESATIAVCERSWTTNNTDQNLVQILKLDFRTGISTRLVLNNYSDPDSHRFKDVKICGNIACVAVHGPSGNYWILMDWGTDSYLKLASNTLASPLLVNLILNHVLVLTNTLSGAPDIRVINITAFSGHWQHTADPPTLPTVYVSDIEADICESITFGNCARFRQPFKRDLHAYQSPLEAGTYRIWLFLSGYRGSSSKRGAALCSYHLSLSGDKIMWRKRTAANSDPISIHCPGITYSGHTRWDNRDDKFKILTPGDLDRVVEQSLPGVVPYAPLSPYSGALSYVAKNTLVVSYFK
ncbi:hypothetical protein FB451DRAFT_387697 [Mycena latifolia]|nr:hypothetical protein FB451DRAFT_387697 [Mycena latifolia]